ncbi:WS_DGAT_C domain-containing protein [Pseudomonas chlororaphis]
MIGFLEGCGLHSAMMAFCSDAICTVTLASCLMARGGHRLKSPTHNMTKAGLAVNMHAVLCAAAVSAVVNLSQ